jgi:hypothetical protein
MRAAELTTGMITPSSQLRYLTRVRCAPLTFMKMCIASFPSSEHCCTPLLFAGACLTYNYDILFTESSKLSATNGVLEKPQRFA